MPAPDDNDLFDFLPEGERETGEEVAARADQERAEARPDAGGIRAPERAEARRETAEAAQHRGLGGSDISVSVVIGV